MKAIFGIIQIKGRYETLTIQEIKTNFIMLITRVFKFLQFIKRKETSIQAKCFNICRHTAYIKQLKNLSNEKQFKAYYKRKNEHKFLK
ncbi:unnamed protein product [Paramecium sonneborni]|uniref:Uncharacterized protein n=1 Tax=Paramecium sonneborni TaxID=65129 RepID=A0A8S1RRQ9_9CILI|nr:unnamed protein product [Paramecium sonneborni]